MDFTVGGLHKSNTIESGGRLNNGKWWLIERKGVVLVVVNWTTWSSGDGGDKRVANGGGRWLCIEDGGDDGVLKENG